MVYEIIVQDFALPFDVGANYLIDANPYSDIRETYLIEPPQENPNELFKDKGMGRISTNKSEYEIEPVEFYQDMVSEPEEYVLEEVEEDDVHIVSWDKEETEDILKGLDDAARTLKEHGKELADEDVILTP
jgi:hypothetical protein